MGFHEDMAAGYGFAGSTVRLGRPYADPAAPDTGVEVAIVRGIFGMLRRRG